MLGYPLGRWWSEPELWASSVHPGDLYRAFFSTRVTRRLDALGYARVKH